MPKIKSRVEIRLKLDMKNSKDRRLHIEITVSNPEKKKFFFFAAREDREKMGSFNREKIALFSIQTVAEEMKRIYETI